MTYEEYCAKRDALLLSDNAVANFSGVSKSTISQWKNGKLEPSKRTLQRLDLFLENYDPNKTDYYISQPLKDNAQCDADRPIKERFWVESFGVRINSGIPVELTARQFDELKKNTEIYADTWLKAHRIIN